MSTLFATFFMKFNRIFPQESKFLQRLEGIVDPPDKLYYIGNLPEGNRKVVSIVGTRHPTPYGQAVTEQIASKLAEKGVIVVSGLALGIDSIAHQAVLNSKGVTVAVLPVGLDTIYPKSHETLARQIVKSGGLLLSECEPGLLPHQYRFLARNRLISGVSDAVIVIEAATRSGTLSTVSHALRQGVSVYAVPGNITSPMSQGCNRLIGQGATPLCNVDDLLDDLEISNQKSPNLIPRGDSEEENKVLLLISEGITDGEALLARSQLEASLFNSTMTMLELKCSIRPLGGNHWRLG
jgi:DNA processing protein